MENAELVQKAEEISQELQKSLEVLAKEFDQKVKDAGQQYGLRLSTEINVSFES